jgi:hypothetical protein
MKQYNPTIGDIAKRALDAYEAALAPPAEILARTFGLIRVQRTAIVADSIAYVYEHIRTPFGQRCRAYRITEHPHPPPQPQKFDAKDTWRNPGADRNPDLKPTVDTVEVSCNDRRMEAVVPGSLKTPVPRHP